MLSAAALFSKEREGRGQGVIRGFENTIYPPSSLTLGFEKVDQKYRLYTPQIAQKYYIPPRGYIDYTI